MKRRWTAWVGGIALLMAGPLMAATCQASAPGLPFSAYIPWSTTSQTVTTQLSLSCSSLTKQERTRGVVVSVLLSAGQGSASDRYMVLGTDHLHYNVYQDAALQFLMTDTPGPHALHVCIGSPQCGKSATATRGNSLSLTLYGAIPPQQNVAMGIYRDSLTLSLVY